MKPEQVTKLYDKLTPQHHTAWPMVWRAFHHPSGFCETTEALTMTLKTRLAKLEGKINTVLVPVIVFSVDGVFDEEQQARLDQAKNEGRQVKIIHYEII